MVRDSLRPFKSADSADPSLTKLQRKLILLISIAVIITILGGWLLSRLWEPVYALRWAALSLGVLAYQVVLLWKALPRNYRRDEGVIVGYFGLGNLLTIVRGLCLCWLAGLIISPRPNSVLAWLPAGFYLIADILDYFDGLAARLSGLSTELGSYWDQELDSLGVVIAPLLGVRYGQLPLWALLVSASRYLFIMGLRWRKFRHKPVFDLPPSVYRRAFAGFQMGFFGFALLPIFPAANIRIALIMFMIPFMLGFLRDWLVVSGAIDVTQASYQKMVQFMTRLGMQITPVLLRVIVILTSLRIGITYLAGSTAMLLPGISPPNEILGLLEITLALLLGLGIGGRIAALAFLLVAGFSLNGQEISVILLLACASYMTVLGTGAFSIWQPEQEFVRRRYGGAGSAGS